jgi:hypothetical protein
MGEYIRIKGETVKLGTCESLYYIRYQQAEELRALGICEKMNGNDMLDGYMGGSYRFRFPFPDEDEIAVGDFDDHDRGVRVALSDDAWARFRDFCTDHGTFWVQVHPKHSCKPETPGGYVHEPLGFNLELPCPAVGDLSTYHTSSLPSYHALEVVQQKPVAGEVWVVVRCPWCGEMWRLPADEAMVLANEVRQQTCYHAPGFWAALADRIEAGYKTAVQTVTA